jgi:hypothetical protein
MFQSSNKQNYIANITNKRRVPQGSKISPLLFNLYVSDFPTTNNTEVSLNANVCAIYSRFKDVETITKNVQDHLNIIQKREEK